MITKEESNFIKLVAISTMLIDHIGLYFFPGISLLRIIGRIAFPLFCHQLTIGYQMTSSKINYAKRLFLFGLISQIPYYLLKKDIFAFNIFFTLFVGLLGIWAIDSKKYHFLIILLPVSYFISYQIYGFLLILFFWVFRSNLFYKLLTFFILVTVYAEAKGYISYYALMAVPFIVYPIGKIKLPNNLFYIFYPAHLFIILIIRILLF